MRTVHTHDILFISFRLHIILCVPVLTVQVFKVAYCDYFDPSKAVECDHVCKSFVASVSEHQPDMLKKQKVHLLLHLTENMDQFGPTSAFNSER